MIGDLLGLVLGALCDIVGSINLSFEREEHRPPSDRELIVLFVLMGVGYVVVWILHT